MDRGVLYKDGARSDFVNDPIRLLRIARRRDECHDNQREDGDGDLPGDMPRGRGDPQAGSR
jgi:hypothetical protein